MARRDLFQPRPSVIAIDDRTEELAHATVALQNMAVVVDEEHALGQHGCRLHDVAVGRGSRRWRHRAWDRSRCEARPTPRRWRRRRVGTRSPTPLRRRRLVLSGARSGHESNPSCRVGVVPGRRSDEPGRGHRDGSVRGRKHPRARSVEDRALPAELEGVHVTNRSLSTVTITSASSRTVDSRRRRSVMSPNTAITTSSLSDRCIENARRGGSPAERTTTRATPYSAAAATAASNAGWSAWCSRPRSPSASRSSRRAPEQQAGGLVRMGDGIAVDRDRGNGRPDVFGEGRLRRLSGQVLPLGQDFSDRTKVPTVVEVDGYQRLRARPLSVESSPNVPRREDPRSADLAVPRVLVPHPSAAPALPHLWCRA